MLLEGFKDLQQQESGSFAYLFSNTGKSVGKPKLHKWSFSSKFASLNKISSSEQGKGERKKNWKFFISKNEGFCLITVLLLYLMHPWLSWDTFLHFVFVLASTAPFLHAYFLLSVPTFLTYLNTHADCQHTFLLILIPVYRLIHRCSIGTEALSLYILAPKSTSCAHCAGVCPVLIKVDSCFQPQQICEK